MKLVVITVVLSLCLMVSMAHPYVMSSSSEADAQEMPADAGYPHMPFDAERVKAQHTLEQIGGQLKQVVDQTCIARGKSINVLLLTYLPTPDWESLDVRPDFKWIGQQFVMTTLISWHTLILLCTAIQLCM